MCSLRLDAIWICLDGDEPWPSIFAILKPTGWRASSPRIQGNGITEAVKSALETKLKEERKKLPLMERIKDITDEIAAYPIPA